MLFSLSDESHYSTNQEDLITEKGIVMHHIGALLTKCTTYGEGTIDPPLPSLECILVVLRFKC